MRINLFYVVNILLIFLLIYSSLSYSVENTSMKKDIRKQRFKDSITIANLKKVVFINSEALNITFPNKILLTDSNNRTLTLREVMTQEKIVYRFSETNCMLCVEKYAPFLNYFARQFGKDRVVILGSFTNPAHLWLILKKYQLKDIDTYNLPSHYLQNEKIEQLNEPYVFVLNPSLDARSIFIPQKEIPQLATYYQSNLYLSKHN